VIEVAGQLPSRNTDLRGASQCLKKRRSRFVPGATGLGSPYLTRMIQGADIIPRCFWFTRVPPVARIVDHTRPQLESDQNLERLAKKPWKGLRVRGSVEREFLFSTLLSSHLVPFGYESLSLIVLPFSYTDEGKILLTRAAAAESGKPGLAEWLRRAEAHWSAHAKEGSIVKSIYERLDYYTKLTMQTPKGPHKLLYNADGTHLCSCVLNTSSEADTLNDLRLGGFFADQTTYWFETESRQEAHYLCGILNAPCVDIAIKPFQTKGSFGSQSGKGERHIHRRPFEVLAIPTFVRDDPTHKAIAAISQRCHDTVRRLFVNEEFSDEPIGRLRNRVRARLVDALRDLDVLVAKVIPGV